MIDQLRHRRATLPERCRAGRASTASSASLDARTKELRRRSATSSVTARRALEQQIEASTDPARDAREAALRWPGRGVARAPGHERGGVAPRPSHQRARGSRDRGHGRRSSPSTASSQAGDVTRARARRATPSACGRPSPPPRCRLDAELAERETGRAAAAASGVRDDLLARYEQLRSKLGGTGAARLVGGSCSGCHLALSVDGARPRPQGASRRRDHLRAVRPDPGALTRACSSSFGTARPTGNAAGQLLGRRRVTADGPGPVRRRRPGAGRSGPVGRLVSSPLGRARDTAEALGLALPVEVDERWIEVDYGELEGERAR